MQSFVQTLDTSTTNPLVAVSDADLNTAARLKVLLGNTNSMVAVSGLSEKDDAGPLAIKIAAGLSTLDPHLVLLIDGDVRKADLHKRISCEAGMGLSDILDGSEDLDKAIHPTIRPNLFFTPLGSAASSLSTLLNGHSAQAVFADLRTRFRWIVVNAGVITATPEGILLGAASDGVVAGLPKGKCHRQDVEKIVADINRLGMNLLGAVLLERW